MSINRLKEFLDAHQVKYVTIRHSPAYTAQEVAHSAHITGKEMAKTVMVKLDGKLAMVVLPATCRVSLPLLQEATGVLHVHLAREDEFADVFPNCELGAMPPFGNLYGLTVYVADRLTEDEMISFNAGSHTELIRMPYADFERLVQPRVVTMTT